LLLYICTVVNVNKHPPYSQTQKTFFEAFGISRFLRQEAQVFESPDPLEAAAPSSVVGEAKVEAANRQRILLTPTQIRSDSSEAFEANLAPVSAAKPDLAVVEKPSTEKRRILELAKHTSHQIGVRKTEISLVCQFAKG
jgi:hypothetical protein